ncbi:491aa72c-e70d-4401-8951-bd7f61bcbbe2 [Thermothielavioides terrestris]|nr:491aa72c-e70d-4401-8951-bd7f61bcbbe2 [Thermothielavioides terrestris]
MSTPDHFGWPQPPMLPPGLVPPYQMPGMPPVPAMLPMPFDALPLMRPGHGASDLNSPGPPFNINREELSAQAELLEGLCNTVVADAEIERAEIVEKENFRLKIESVARAAIAEYERSQNGFHAFPPESVQLKCFGSLASGFATKASDMDLGLLSPLSRIQPDAPGSPIPRLVEKAFLDIGLGARLLTRTRVPIIKVCEKPPEKLRLLLLAEREKWERGLLEAPHEDEAQEGADAHSAEDVQPEAQAEAQAQEEVLTPEQKLQRIKQGATSSLSSYYGSVKRVLRMLGCRDVTHSTVAEFKAEDVKLLNQVCLAFVDGLADSKLRDRLLTYRSLNRYDLLSCLKLRTLLGVFTQVEGEQLALAWESRPFQEKDSARERAAESTVRAWRELQNSPDYGRDPMGYQKELQLAVEQLKKIPSIQVLLLSQAHNETATSYCSRASRLLHELVGHDSPARADAVLPTLVRHYIAGILNPSIREQVERFQQSHGVTNLRIIGRRHKSLQLALEYETCLGKRLYSDETAAKVRRYVEFLRASTAKPPAAGHHSLGVVPLPPDLAPLLSEIRLLGDPSKAAPNQPRDRYNSALEFPKSGVGVQCDINFSAHLAIQNTLLLRCYSHCDPRVRPLVLFVKHWAKVRRINSPYRGTLGSYGYALMMLHYLVNVAQPFVCPNLQQLARPPDPNLTPQQVEETVMCKGRDIQFWRDEAEIIRLARDNALTQNRESVGELLRGFFEYYAKGGSPMSTLPCRSFDWGRDVLSLRTHGGLLSKQAKGWTGAKTVVEVNSAAAPDRSPPPPPPPSAAAAASPDVQPFNTNSNVAPAAAAGEPEPEPLSQTQPQPQNAPAAVEVREIRYRYLFAIEDPFELDHNIARTVTHAGIVQIRDEFRRAWRIIKNAGRSALQGDPSQNQSGTWRHEDLLEDVVSVQEAREREQFAKLLEELHGVRFDEGDGGDGEGAAEGEGAADNGGEL